MGWGDERKYHLSFTLSHLLSVPHELSSKALKLFCPLYPIVLVCLNRNLFIAVWGFGALVIYGVIVIITQTIIENSRQ